MKLLLPILGWLLLAAPTTAAASDADPDALFERAKVLSRQTRFAEARDTVLSAVEIFERRGDDAGRYNSLLLLVGVYRDAGDLDAAAATIAKALDGVPGDDDGRLFARGLHQRAQVRSRRDDPDGARADLAEAGAIYARLGLEVERAETDAVAAIVASWQGDFAAAAELARRALPRLEGGGERFRVGALAALAYSLQELGLLEEAITAYDELIPRAWARNDQRNLNFAFCNRADLRWRLGQPKGSEEDLRRAVAGFEAARLRIWGGPDERRDYLGRQIEAYDRLILLLAQTYRGAEAFDVAERFHARSFLELLAETDLDRAARFEPELRRRESELVAALTALTAGRRGANGEDPAAELEELRRRIRHADPRYADLVAAEPLEAVAARQALAPGEALVAYWMSEELALAWVLTPDKTRFVWLPVRRDELEREVAAYLEPLRSADRAVDLGLKGEERAHLEGGRRLYRWLIESLPPAAREAETLIVVRDGFLHHLPFEALPTDCEPAGDQEGDDLHAVYARCGYFGLEKPILYAPSASVFASLRRRAGETSGDLSALLAVAPFPAGAALPGSAAERSRLGALPFSADEARAVAGVFPRARALIGAEASESRLRAAIDRAGVLHLATHGLADDAEPMRSALLLHPGDGEDGRLEAREVLALDLDSPLVTLSACRSARGELNRAEGWIGLTRSFLYAGASRVVASLWDVDDRSTSDLMAVFYRELEKGTPTAEALRRARVDLAARSGQGGLVFRRRAVRYAHPRYWAGFTLQGVP